MAKEVASSIPGIGFLREAKAELKKVTWPGRKQIWFSTLSLKQLYSSTLNSLMIPSCKSFIIKVTSLLG